MLRVISHHISESCRIICEAPCCLCGTHPFLVQHFSGILSKERSELAGSVLHPANWVFAGLIVFRAGCCRTWQFGNGRRSTEVKALQKTYCPKTNHCKVCFDRFRVACSALWAPHSKMTGPGEASWHDMDEASGAFIICSRCCELDL